MNCADPSKESSGNLLFQGTRGPELKKQIFQALSEFPMLERMDLDRHDMMHLANANDNIINLLEA